MSGGGFSVAGAVLFVVVPCVLCFLLGTVGGWDWGRRRLRRDLAEDRAERAAGEWLDQLRDQRAMIRETSPAAMARMAQRTRVAIDYRPAPIPGLGTPIWARFRTDEEVAHEAWLAHSEQAIDLANGDPITTGEIQAIHDDMDVFLAGLLARYPVPYPDGDQQL